MARRPTIPDLAEAAGVSVTTVDRVLNGRAKVREETARKVYEAAQRIGYHAAGLIGQRLLPVLPELTVGVVLHKERQAFYQAFRAELEAAAQRAQGVHARVRIAFSPSQAPQDFVAQFEALAPRVDVMAGTAVSHVAVSDCVARLQEQGIACYALLNDFAQGIRQSYIGLNNLKVGRIAAHMILKSVHKEGKIAVFVGGYRWHGHELREAGFRSYMREYGPRMTVLDTLVNLETRQLTYEATLDLLDRHRDLRGIYCAGGGMEGAIAALREARAPGEVELVVNELTPESRLGLADRYVAMAIATPLQRVCDDLMGLALSGQQRDTAPVPGQHFLRPDLYLPESI
ncbi:LacI family DNA-binding transcriptional regulator [Histidinibacterium lentulum]|uniref:LacI family DNA-binding transcriptional regulator n=1 Tax=Histidinibacterium lentulum TaxID=2480588 RepID=A0A3N2QTB6_9RHOB|nr:LacI family DNA-binding transcriptional regulator [Histidinibacterium lentulum]ROT98472.1 LacI family DNA-binding transcriptional regulator [Histidinibacterium lentulum]